MAWKGKRVIVVRPTQSLAKRMKVKLLSEPVKSTNILGDWYAQEIVLKKKQFIFCMSENGRLPVVMEAAPYAKFQDRLADSALHVFRAIGVPEKLAQQECQAMHEFRLGKTDNRSVLGVMKQFYLDLQHSTKSLEEPLEISLRLANMGTLSLDEFLPKDAVTKLFGAPDKIINT